MAYPLLLTSLALTAAGTGTTIAGQEQAKSAMDDSRKAELTRQQQFEQKGRALFDQSMKGSSPTTNQNELSTAADAREAAYNQAQAVAGTSAPAAAPQNRVTGESPTAQATKLSQVTNNAWTRMGNRAEAKLHSYDDWGVDQNVKNQRVGTELGVNSQEARSSAAVLPYEMNHASHAGDAMQGLGTMLSALGSVTSMGAAVAPAAAPSLAAKQLAMDTLSSTAETAGRVGGWVTTGGNPWAIAAKLAQN